METSQTIQEILDTLPAKPGCYLMKNQKGEIIYVGKAINLRSRVRSYFHSSGDLSPKTHRLVNNIANIDWIVVGSELEALILEMTLIKKHKPTYNVRLKDDKRYPYIKVHWADPFPKVTVTREMTEDGSRFYGPYTSGWAVHQTLDVLRRIFPYLTCNREITGEDRRACLYYDIKLCNASCIGAIRQEEYRDMIENLCQFLSGKTEEIKTNLSRQMENEADQLRFEQAAVIRDRLSAIDKVVERQKVISTDQVNSDVIAMARSDGEACVQVFFIRNGKLIGREYFILEGTEDENTGEIISQFLKQFYKKAAVIPEQVLLPQAIEEARIIQQWMNTRKHIDKVEIKVPKDGPSHELVQMAAENASETLQALKAQWVANREKQSQALAELQHALDLSEPPNRIECYDISNTQGTAAVGSMVVFEQGVPNKKLYRRFNIKSVIGPDDFASMEEVLDRRFKRWQSAAEAQDVGKKVDLAFSLLPDLLIVDGGKGQLSRAEQVMQRYGLQGKFLITGLAKQQEELFLPQKKDSLLLPRHSQGLYLVQRIRDEAHRFAITAHRKVRTKQGIASRLDAIPGVGPSLRKALLARFGSIEGITQATLEEVAEIKGISTKLAQMIKDELE